MCFFSETRNPFDYQRIIFSSAIVSARGSGRYLINTNLFGTVSPVRYKGTI